MFFLALAGCAVNLVNLFVLETHVGHSHGPGEEHGCGGHRHSQSGSSYEHSHSTQGASRTIVLSSEICNTVWRKKVWTPPCQHRLIAERVPSPYR